MSMSLRRNALSSRLKALLTVQRFDRSLTESGAQTQFYADMGSASVLERGKINMSNWRKLDSRTLGITRSMISLPSWIVLKILQSAGFDAYLVGGCVRDILLNKVPKDFDVITTATLQRVKKQFHRSEIVGRRFPICRVHVKGSVIEVSSFETVAKNGKEKEKDIFSQMPHGCDKKDFVLWRDCMRRDFTINSLFFDPLMYKIYDYADGMMDLKSLKLRTLIPAQLSFEEDCARILRGLRIAARLGLSFSKETENAIRKLSSSTAKLAKSRLMLEVNYMLSYGAAEPSLSLLLRFNILDNLLPFHAAYLAQQARTQSCQSSVMLMKLFSNLDRFVTCDRPSNCNLWVGLLAFHLALVNHPQDALVVWTFASVLYHGSWKEGVKFAREHAQALTIFMPELSGHYNSKSEDKLAKRINEFATIVHNSIDALTETDVLLQKMSRFPGIPCSGLVFVPKKTGRDTAQLFSMLVEYYDNPRESFNIDYDLLGEGHVQEMRFVLGKIIMDTMSSVVVQESKVVEVDGQFKAAVLRGNCDIARPPDIKTRHVVGKEDRKRTFSPPNDDLGQKRAKKQKLVGKTEVANEESKKKAMQKPEMIENNQKPPVAKKHQKENECTPPNQITQKQQNMGNSLSKQQNMENSENEKRHFHTETGVTENNEKRKQDVTEEPKRPVLSSLFR